MFEITNLTVKIYYQLISLDEYTGMLFTWLNFYLFMYYDLSMHRTYTGSYHTYYATHWLIWLGSSLLASHHINLAIKSAIDSPLKHLSRDYKKFFQILRLGLFQTSPNFLSTFLKNRTDYSYILILMLFTAKPPL